MNEEQSQQLQAHIKQQLQNGLTPDEVNAQLKNAGWPDDLISQGFQAVQAAVMPTAMLTPAATSC